MSVKAVIGIVFVIIVVILIGIYYFMPFSEREFFSGPLNYNFTVNGNASNMQFYSDMRFENKEISYRILDVCNIKKHNDMETALDIIENLTILDFYSVSDKEDITITCEEKARFQGNMFIAGEGGPTEAILGGKYIVILHGEILLLKSSDCERPNVAIHELLHALGFVHSENPNNIMYNYTKCKQTIGDEIPELINEIYSASSYSDLVFENVSASMKGRYLNMEMIVKNVGLKKSGPAEIVIKMDNSIIKRLELEELEVGDGKMISISNLFVSKIGLGNLELFIDYSGDELDKTNNNVTLEISE